MKKKIITLLVSLLILAQYGYSQCMADAGTSTVINDGNGNSPFVLCFGDMFEIVSNDDYTLPPSMPPNVPGIMWGLYVCPPTETTDPGADPCWDMSYWTGEDFAHTHDGSIVTFLGGINTFWTAPIASDAVQLPNHDQDGDGCIDVGLGDVYMITLLDEITFNLQNIDNCNGEVTIEIMGGYPEEFPGNYTVVNSGGGNMMQSGPSGEIITITNLGNGDPYSFQVIEDGNGCSANYAGGVMMLTQEDASFVFPPFCPGEPNGPSSIATPGGTFVFNPPPGDGASINPATGEITGATPGSTYFVEYTTGGPCPTTGMPQPVMALVTPPAPMVNPASYIACEGEPIVVSPMGTGGNFNFYNDAALMNLVFSGPFFDPSSFVVPGMTTTFYVTETSGPCEGPPTSFDVLVQPANPPGLTPNSITVCSGDPVTIIPISNNANGTNTFNFYGNAALTNLLFTGSSYTFNPTASTQIFITEEVNGCESESVTFTVNIDPEPAAPGITSPVDICVGDVAPALTANGSGGTLDWYDSDPALGNPVPIGQGSPFTPPLNTNVAGTTNYWVTETSAAGCEGPAALIAVNVNSGPNPPLATDPPAICTGENIPQLTANGSGGTLNWYDADPDLGNPVPLGAGSPFTPPVNNNIPGTTTFWVAETNASGCEGNSTAVTVTVNQAPDAPLANSPNAICVGDPVPLLTANGDGGTLNWYASDPGTGNPPVIGSGSSFTPSIDNSFPGTFNFWVTETAAGNCVSTPTMVAITIDAVPPAPQATDPNPICVGEPVPTINASGSGGILNWYDSDPAVGNPAPVFTGNPFDPPIDNSAPGNTSFWVTEENANGCESEATLIIVSVLNDLPAPVANNPANICINGTIPDLIASGSGGTLNWYDVDPLSGNPVPVGTGSPFTPNVDNSVAGTSNFWVTETNASGCESEATLVNITIEDNPPAPNANAPNGICIDEVVPNLTATGNGGTLNWYDTDPSVGNPVPIGTGSPFSPVVDNSVAGSTTFWVTETSAIGCESEPSAVVINVNALPAISVETTCASDLQTYSVEVMTDGDGVSSTEGTVTDMGGGIFLVEGIIVNNAVDITATITATGCSLVLNVQAPDCNCPGVDAPVSGGDQEICEGDDFPTLTVTVNPGETVDWYDAAVNGTLLLVGSTDYTPTAAGTYYAEARTLDNNCTGMRTGVTITLNPFPQIQIQELSCAPDLLTYIVDIIFSDADQIMVSEGVVMDNGNGSFNIRGIDVNNDLTIIASNSTTNCSEEFLINPIACNCPTVEPPVNDGDEAICEGETIPNLSVSVGMNETADWYDAAIGGTLLQEGNTNFTPTEGGTFYAETRNLINNCTSARTPVTLTVNPLPDIAMAETICADDLLTYDLEIVFNNANVITVSEGTLVDNGNGSFSITGIASGTDIDIMATNTTTGCMDEFMITAPDCNCPSIEEPLSGGDQRICEGEPVPTLSATVGPNETVDWYDAAIGGTLLLAGSTTYTPIQAGIYFAETRTLVDDCISSTRRAVELIVDENPEPVIVEETQPGCVTDNGSISLTVNGGTEPYQYSLDDGITNQSSNIFTDLAAGNFDILVTDDNGCTGITSTTLTAPGGVTANAGLADQLTCIQQMVTLDGSNSSGADDLMFEWTLNGEIVSTEAVFMVEEPGTYVLRVISDDCEDTDEVVVIENITAITADIQNESNLNCIVNSLILDGSNSTSNANTVYQWLFNNAPIAGANAVNYEATMAGDYTLIVIDQSNGCRDSTMATVLLDEDYPVSDAGADQQIDCDTEIVLLDGSASQSGINIVYQWFDPVGEPIPDATTLTISAIISGVYTLEVTDTINGCSNTSTVEVLEDFELPVANAGPDQQIDCDENDTLLDGSGSSTGLNYWYQWTVEGQGNISSGGQTLAPEVDEEGKYALLVTNTDNGCTASDTTDVFEITEIATSFNVEIDQPDCFGDLNGSLIIMPDDNTIPILYALDDQPFSEANQFFNLSPGSYSLVAQDDSGCEWETTVVIEAPMELVVNLGDDQLIELGDSIQLEALANVPVSSITNISWTNENLLSCTDCLDPFTTQLKETTAFGIRIIDENGCTAEDAITIFVSKERGVYIPNGFSPNNDGINDVFMIFGGPDVVKVNSFKVFDRWGETIFVQNDFLPNNPDHGWDGSFSDGKILNPAVFVYMAEIEFVDGEKLIFSGDVTLIR